MEIRFDGKRALVTGAGKGIGRGVTLKLVEYGAEVIAVSRTKADLDELAEINSKIHPLCLDVGNWEATKDAIEGVGPVDLLVNNAGISDRKEFGDMSEQDIDETYNINFKAVVNITQIIAKGMIARGQGGSIVNISSIAGVRVAPGLGAYCSSKSAVDHITRCMAAEFGPHNIRVNAIQPTAIRTKMAEYLFEPDNEIGKGLRNKTPLRKLGEVDEIVYPTLFLLSDKASLITGAVIPADGGLTILF